MLYPGNESFPHGSWLPSNTPSTMGQPRNLEDTVKILSLGVQLQDFLVVVRRLLQGNEAVGLDRRQSVCC